MNAGVKHLWLVVLFAGCPPTAGDCRVGTANQTPPESLLMTAGLPQTFSFIVDGPACELPEGALTARPVLSTPSGATVPVTVARVVQVSQQDFFASSIELDLDVPALEPGTHFLQVFIEPTLGAFQVPIFVAANRRRDAGFVVSFQEVCQRPARTTAGTQFCADRDAGFFAFRAGQRTSMPGVERLLTAGNVAWAVGRSELRRYEDQPDAGLVQTGATTLLTLGTGGWADEASLIVGNSRYDFVDGGLERRSIGLVSGTRWTEGQRVLSVTPGSICNDLSFCVVNGSGARFFALDATHLWLVHNLGATSDAPEFTTMRLLRRPVTPDAGDAFSLAIPPGFQPMKSAPNELSAGLPPLLFSMPDAGPRRMLLLNQGREGTSVDLLSPEVLGASRDWLFLAGDAPNELRVIPLPLSP